MNGTREVCKRHANFAGMRLGVGNEFLKGLEGGMFAGNHNDRQQRCTAHGFEVRRFERLAARRHIGLQNHRAECGKVNAGTVSRSVMNLAPCSAHQTVFKIERNTELLFKRFVEIETQGVIRTRFERMKDRYGTGRKCRGFFGGMKTRHNRKDCCGGKAFEKGATRRHSLSPKKIQLAHIVERFNGRSRRKLPLAAMLRANIRRRRTLRRQACR